MLPGTKSTVDDLAWLRAQGLADACPGARAPAASRCWGSAAGTRCWPSASTTRWRAAGVRSPGSAWSRSRSPSGRPRCSADRWGRAVAVEVRGYEIHHGYESRRGPVDAAAADGDRRSRRACAPATSSGRTGTARSRATGSAAGSSPRPPGSPAGDFTVAPDTAFGAARERMLDRLGDLVERPPRHRRPVAAHLCRGAFAPHDPAGRLRSAGMSLTEEQVRAAVAAQMPGVRADLENLVRIPGIAFDGFDFAEVERSAAGRGRAAARGRAERRDRPGRRPAGGDRAPARPARRADRAALRPPRRAAHRRPYGRG